MRSLQVDTCRGEGRLVQRQGPSPGHTPETSVVGAGEGGGALFSRRNVSVKVREVLGQAAVPSVMQPTLILRATLSLLEEGMLPEPAGTRGRCHLLPAAPNSPPSGVLGY